jgi:ubiquinol-cytochrome c reductase cytochrome b subunit
MNKLGSAGHPLPGTLLRPDPVDETIALERARAEQHVHEHADEVESERAHGEMPVD